jgi:hypothetical protein
MTIKKQSNFVGHWGGLFGGHQYISIAIAILFATKAAAALINISTAA